MRRREARMSSMPGSASWVRCPSAKRLGFGGGDGLLGIILMLE
jgi:hypothetical protein